MGNRQLSYSIALCIILLTAVSTTYGKKRTKGGPLCRVRMEVPKYRGERNFIHTKVEFPERTIKLYDTISITFIGDVMQHGKQLASALADTDNPNNPCSYDYSSTFRHIEDRLKEADLAVANMEFPLGTPPYKGYPAFSAPESIAWKAKECGIDLFLLANNHILDRGMKGLLNTIKVYEDMGGRYIGAYRNKEDESAMNPVFLNIKGIRVAFLNFTYGTNGFAVPEPCTVNLMDSLHVKGCIRKARNMGADIIVCMPHWGEEYMLRPSAQQKQWAKMLQREGVRVIVGSHPHVPQTAEISGENILFYSLGNYISNQTTPDFTQLELMVTIHIAKNFHTGAVTLPEPEIEFLWCFKKGEYDNDYTVVPVKEIIGKKGAVKDMFQYGRMEKAYRSFLEQELIKKLDTH